MWSHDVISTSIGLAGDLKMGQYREHQSTAFLFLRLKPFSVKIPPRIMFLTQVWGTILGALINYIVMISIVTARREVLLDPQGTNVWSGQNVQVNIDTSDISTSCSFIHRFSTPKL